MDAIKAMIRKLAEAGRRALAMAARAIRAAARQLVKVANLVSPPPVYRFTFPNAAVFTGPLTENMIGAYGTTWPHGQTSVTYTSG